MTHMNANVELIRADVFRSESNMSAAVISRKRLCELCVFNFASFAVKPKSETRKGRRGRPELLSPARRARGGVFVGFYTLTRVA